MAVLTNPLTGGMCFSEPTAQQQMRARSPGCDIRGRRSGRGVVADPADPRHRTWTVGGIAVSTAFEPNTHQQGFTMNIAAKKPPQKTDPARDATAMLRADHKLVSGLFAQYEKTQSTAKKKQLVAEICTELSVHAQVEEEIFYPAVKEALHDHELVPEATVEHATLKALICGSGRRRAGRRNVRRQDQGVERVRETPRERRAHGNVPKGESNRSGYESTGRPHRRTQREVAR